MSRTRLSIIVIIVLLAMAVSGCSVLEQLFAGQDDEPLQSMEPLPTLPMGESSRPWSKYVYNDILYAPDHLPNGAGDGAVDEFRAVWVASVLNLDFPSRRDFTVAEMKAEIDAIVARTAELGLNAIIFQVRPTGDALYKSEIFPWSHWLTGTQGVGVEGFDPLAYWIEACHVSGIELHAWLNPYRIIHTSANSSNPETLAAGNPVRLRPELAVAWSASNGNRGLFLDPGLPDARALIIDGIEEIARNYDIDGIHIDDYFYPGTDFNDAASFAKHGNGMELGDWRRENVNLLIRGIQAAIRGVNEEQGKNVRWGISPTAIWMNESNNPLGVPTTRGQESYHALYADTRLWVTEEWVDYICPQIYWYIGFGTANFEPILNWWADLCKDYNVDLYIGHAAYREDQDDQAPNWRGEMLRQLEMAASSTEVKGSVFYRIHSLRGAVGAAIRDFYADKDSYTDNEPVMLMDTLSVGTPEQNASITASRGATVGYNITGVSDPRVPLYMNGAEITNRTAEGFFSVFAPLTAGANGFTFTQEGQADVTRTITRNAPGGGGSQPSPSPTVTQFTTPRYATVTESSTWAFPGHSTSGGSDWMLFQGQTDRAVSESSNGFVRLSSGVWVNRSNISLSTQNPPPQNPLRSGVYREGTDYDMLVWQSEINIASYASYDGRVLTVKFGLHDEPPPLSLPADLAGTMFESYSSGMDGGTPYYAFTLRADAGFEGHYTDFADGEYRLHLKKRKTLAPGSRPLTGITIVIDPGHGGTESGAIGPMGTAMPEKELTLINSLKLAERLRALGATVHLTRDRDVSIPLQDRIDLTWQTKPDLFLSLHINSVAETTNATNIRGFTVWYRNPGSAPLAQTILDNMYYVNPATNRNRNINQANFFVCRPQWTPSVLLEAGFIVNIEDFAWLVNPTQQNRMADMTVDAILEYFR